jgi:ABC-2 type transport system permease protein
MNKALFKENIKRFWPISAVAALIYFMSGPFLLLLQKDNASVFTARNLVSNFNLGFLFMDCALPVIICAAVFMYLYRMNSTVVMHSLPFSRSSLFVTNYLSGMVLSTAPAVLTALTMFAIKASNVLHFIDDTVWNSLPAGAVSWSTGGIALWLAITLVDIFFVFSLCSFGAVISGNMVICLLTGCALNLVVQGVILAHYAYCSTFLFGYSDNSFNWKWLASIHPVTHFVTNNSQALRQDGPSGMKFILLSAAAYIAVSCVVSVLAWAVYKKRANERTGDSYVFGAAGFIIGLLLVFLGSSAVGLIFNDSFGLWGFVVSGVCCFIIAQMIIRKTPKIFDKGILKPMAAAVVMMAVVMGCYIFDLTGYESRVPDVSDVKIVHLKTYDVNFGFPYDLEDPQAVEAVTDLHKEIVAHKDELMTQEADKEYTSEEEAEDEGWTWIDLDYELKSGRRLSRSMKMPYKYLKASEGLKTIVMTGSYNVFEGMVERADPENITMNANVNDWGDLTETNAEKYGDVQYADVPVTEYSGSAAEAATIELDKKIAALSGEEKIRLLEAISDDYSNMPFEALIMSSPRYATYGLWIHVEYDDMDEALYEQLSGYQSRLYYIWFREKTDYQPQSYVENVNLEVDENWPRTMAFLDGLLESGE